MSQISTTNAVLLIVDWRSLRSQFGHSVDASNETQPMFGLCMREQSRTR